MVRNIGVFGRRNVGKSSFVNTFTGQDVSIVSPVAGTTTDPVKKRMEIPGVGICNIIDTAGIDDCGLVGDLRVKKSERAIRQIDLAILLFSDNIFAKPEMDLLERFCKLGLPVLIVHGKSDMTPLDDSLAQELNARFGADVVEYSSILGKEEMAMQQNMVAAMIFKLFSAAEKYEEKPLLDGFVEENDTIVLVCPVDSQAPAKRLILPQVMAIRDVLDHKGRAVVLQPQQLPGYMEKNNNGADIKLVVTDSQAFPEVNAMLPPYVHLTSFSILMARAKGPFEEYLRGIRAIDGLKSGDRVLILESCTHHVTCEDIGRVKIPGKLRRYLEKKNNDVDFVLEFDFVAGTDEIPHKNYGLAIQCGGCMVTKRELVNRVGSLVERNIPVTNYGMAIAFLSGIMERVCYEPHK